MPTSLRPSLGETTSSICTVSGGEAFQGWFKGNNRISDSTLAPVHVTSNGEKHTLNLVGVKVNYGGEYECRGSFNRPAKLTVEIGGKYC